MRRVLIVGRDVLLRDMMASLLVDMPMEVHIVSSVADVEKRCWAGYYDLVVMLDLSHFFDGSAPIALLRPSGLSFPKFFVISWQHSERNVMGLLECGVTQYLTLPVNIRRLRRKICESLNGTH